MIFLLNGLPKAKCTQGALWFCRLMRIGAWNIIFLRSFLRIRWQNSSKVRQLILISSTFVSFCYRYYITTFLIFQHLLWNYYQPIKKIWLLTGKRLVFLLMISISILIQNPFWICLRYWITLKMNFEFVRQKIFVRFFCFSAKRHRHSAFIIQWIESPVTTGLGKEEIAWAKHTQTMRSWITDARGLLWILIALPKETIATERHFGRENIFR